MHHPRITATVALALGLAACGGSSPADDLDDRPAPAATGAANSPDLAGEARSARHRVRLAAGHQAVGVARGAGRVVTLTLHR